MARLQQERWDTVSFPMLNVRNCDAKKLVQDGKGLTLQITVQVLRQNICNKSENESCVGTKGRYIGRRISTDGQNPVENVDVKAMI